MEKAIAYIRVSSQRQVDEGGSLESQTKQVKQYSDSHCYDLINIFREEGESAKSERRPELQRMLKFCSDKKNGVQIVIIPKIDRLSRNVHDYFNLKVQLSRKGVRLESLGERIEDTPSGRLTEAMFASMAQFDNEIRAERSKGGMTEAVLDGRWVWKAPVGYRNIRLNGRGNIEPDPSLASVVRQAFELFADGHQSSRLVRDFLRKKGVPINQASFYKFIKNEVYIGRIHAFGKIVPAKSPFVPIVEESLFYRAQACLRRSATPQTYQKDPEEFPLRGVMMCDCGAPYTAYWARSATGKKYAYYRCMRCPGRNIRRVQVESDFQEHLSSYEYDASGWELVKNCLLEWQDRSRAARIADVQTASERIVELKKLRDNIVIKNANDVIPDDLAKEQIARISNEIADATLDSAEAMPATSIEELIAFAERFLADIRLTWDVLSMQTKKNLLRFMYPDGILYVPNGGFRTQSLGVPEPLNRALLGDLSGLVDPRNEFSNSLRTWLVELQAIGTEAPYELKDREEVGLSLD
jgi:site-specific DNA recombinase